MLIHEYNLTPFFSNNNKCLHCALDIISLEKIQINK